jgi:hypothetical protein
VNCSALIGEAVSKVLRDNLRRSVLDVNLQIWSKRMGYVISEVVEKSENFP